MSEIRVFDYLEPVYIKKIESIVEISNENDNIDLSCPINEEGTVACSPGNIVMSPIPITLFDKFSTILLIYNFLL